MDVMLGADLHDPSHPRERRGQCDVRGASASGGAWGVCGLHRLHGGACQWHPHLHPARPSLQLPAQGETKGDEEGARRGRGGGEEGVSAPSRQAHPSCTRAECVHHVPACARVHAQPCTESARNVMVHRCRSNADVDPVRGRMWAQLLGSTGQPDFKPDCPAMMAPAGAHAEVQCDEALITPCQAARGGGRLHTRHSCWHAAAVKW
eukprot:2054019-Pyramimonas_sp.AAC.1